jgi:hypothetical protein
VTATLKSYTTQAARTPYARALQYDPDFERALVDIIGKAILDASLITDCNVLAIRTGETIHALTAVLGGMIAVSPALRSPTATRKAIDEISKRLRRQVAAARNDPEVASFTRSVFNGTQTGGNA